MTTLKERESAQAKRNMNPHAEARLAMRLWSHEYAHEQRGGSMDFWDSLDDNRKARCVAIVNDVLRAHKGAGRAPPNGRRT